MIEQNTIKLLRECDAGVKMGISSIEDVLDHVQADSSAAASHSQRTAFAGAVFLCRDV